MIRGKDKIHLGQKNPCSNSNILSTVGKKQKRKMDSYGMYQ